jgi:hypothetical protein
VLEYCVLALLRDGERHAFELVRTLAEAPATVPERDPRGNQEWAAIILLLGLIVAPAVPVITSIYLARRARR